LQSSSNFQSPLTGNFCTSIHGIRTASKLLAYWEKSRLIVLRDLRVAKLSLKFLRASSVIYLHLFRKKFLLREECTQEKGGSDLAKPPNPSNLHSNFSVLHWRYCHTYINKLNL